jgi:type III polyketide synthase
LKPNFEQLIASTPALSTDPFNFFPSNYDWALHPGGYAIITAAQGILQLDRSHLNKSYEVYENKGNTSSSTVLSIMDQLAQEEKNEGHKERDKVIAAAFGPGIAVEMAVLRRSRSFSSHEE